MYIINITPSSHKFPKIFKHILLVKQFKSGDNDVNNYIEVFIDLVKAFDIANYKILLEKVELFGIRGKALNLIESNLINGEQIGENVNETKFLLWCAARHGIRTTFI